MMGVSNRLEGRVNDHPLHSDLLWNALWNVGCMVGVHHLSEDPAGTGC